MSHTTPAGQGAPSKGDLLLGRQGTTPLASEIRDAHALLKEGKTDAALTLCQQTMEAERLSLGDLCVLAGLLRILDQTEAAGDIWTRAQAGLQDSGIKGEAAVDAILDAAQVLADIEALDEVEHLCRRAHEIEPDYEKALIGLLDILHQRGKTPEAIKIAQGFSTRNEDTFETLLYLATVFSHLEAPEAMTHFMEIAQARKMNRKQRARLHFLMAGNGMAVAELDQSGMAVALFDNFANSYDEKLAKIGNRGPEVIRMALEELGLPKKKTRRILDAGCGTGLCGDFLRRYAKELTGVDISVNMLKKAEKRAMHHYLARTDLSERMTYPEGTFDMVVCADVLVYFGALNTVFANFAQVLSPGGWLLVTVEDEDDPKAAMGYRLHKSGRYKHSKGYLLKTLADAGFPKPKLMKDIHLRDEMLKPIMGTVFAVQKPAFSFG